MDTEEYGPIPKLWEYPISPPTRFKGGRKTIRWPHTDHKETCPKCGGDCRVRCTSCSGSGTVTRSQYDPETGKHTYEGYCTVLKV